MAKGKFRTRVQKNTHVLNAIRKAMPENTQAFVVEMATDVEENYRALAPRDTTAMAESVYVQLKDGAYQKGDKTSLSAVEAQALSLNPKAEISPSPVPTNETTAYIKPVVKYYIYMEMGTKKMAGRHTMATARLNAQRNLMAKHGAAITKIATDGRR